MPQSADTDAATVLPVLHGWLTRRELAEELSVSVHTLARWKSYGIGPVCINAGNRMLYSRRAVEKWLQDLEQQAEAGWQK